MHDILFYDCSVIYWTNPLGLDIKIFFQINAMI